jgi:hypothetical protein
MGPIPVLIAIAIAIAMIIIIVFIIFFFIIFDNKQFRKKIRIEKMYNIILHVG